MTSPKIEITKNDFDDIGFSGKGNYVLIDQFSEGEGTKIIRVGEETKLTYVLLLKNSLKLDVRIESNGPRADIILKGLILATSESDVNLKIHAHLQHNHAEANLHIISFLHDGSTCEIDGGVDLHKGVSKISGHLLEENIILGENVTIKTLPMLDVHSSDVSASHGARIQKLDPNKMFYMKSKGLSNSQAQELMIKGYFEQIFDGIDDDEVSSIKNEYLNHILQN